MEYAGINPTSRLKSVSHYFVAHKYLLVSNGFCTTFILNNFCQRCTFEKNKHSNFAIVQQLIQENVGKFINECQGKNIKIGQSLS